jgi:hypothetical protein
MATPLDANFGAGFDADAFRAAIRNTMLMGLPSSVPDTVTFTWKESRTYNVARDSTGTPFARTAVPTSTTQHADVQVPVAVEFQQTNQVSGTGAGRFDAASAKITVLDVDYELIKDADYVLLGGDKYEIEYTAPPVGLFTVDVFTLYLRVTDET